MLDATSTSVLLYGLFEIVRGMQVKMPVLEIDVRNAIKILNIFSLNAFCQAWNSGFLIYDLNKKSYCPSNKFSKKSIEGNTWNTIFDFV